MDYDSTNGASLNSVKTGGPFASEEEADEAGNAESVTFEDIETGEQISDTVEVLP